MEKATETWVTGPDRLVSSPRRDACVVHIYPTGPGMGARYALTDTPMVIGRGNDCDIRINDHSVSRRHARIQPGADGYYAVDLQSTNGTFVNDVPASICKLKDGDYLRVGNCIYRYLGGGNVEAEYHEEIYRLAIIDGLTEVPNKRYLLEFLNRELARSARHERPLSLLLFDIDHFKSVNDDRGHLCGGRGRAGGFGLRGFATPLWPFLLFAGAEDKKNTKAALRTAAVQNRPLPSSSSPSCLALPTSRASPSAVLLPLALLRWHRPA